MQDIFKSFIEAWILIISLNRDLGEIILLTLLVTITSTFFAALFGISTGVVLGSREFIGKRLIVRIIQTLMGLPPVVAGLMVYLFLSRKGPLGQLELLFTPAAMVIAQVIIIYPLITGLTIAAVKHKNKSIIETCYGLGIPKIRTFVIILLECRFSIISAILVGFGRAMSEVGAVMLVGGNIQYSTRVMTTAIVLETGKGNYSTAIALGMILLSLSFLINWILQRFQED